MTLTSTGEMRARPRCALTQTTLKRPSLTSDTGSGAPYWGNGYATEAGTPSSSARELGVEIIFEILSTETTPHEGFRKRKREEDVMPPLIGTSTVH